MEMWRRQFVKIDKVDVKHVSDSRVYFEKGGWEQKKTLTHDWHETYERASAAVRADLEKRINKVKQEYETLLGLYEEWKNANFRSD